MDPTASSGNAGRSWLDVQWSVTVLQCPVSQCCLIANCTFIANYLNTHYQDTRSFVKIPSRFFVPAATVGSYQITLQLTNIFQQTAVASTVVKIVQGKVGPLLSISSPMVVNQYRWQTTTLTANIAEPAVGCYRNSSAPISFAWAVYEGITYLPQLSSVSFDPRTFVLPAFTLNVSSTYTVKATAAVGFTVRPGLLSSSATVSVQVKQSGVVAVIAGGAQQTVSASDAVLIDATPSYDVDDPGSFAALVFSWDCVVTGPTFGASCPVVMKNQISPKLSVNPKTLIPSKTYQFTVTVSKSQGLFTSSASVSLYVVPYLIPSIALGSLQQKYNPGNKIILSATVTGVNQTFAAWSSANLTSGQLSAIAFTPLQSLLPAGSSLFQLAIAPNSLVQGFTYNFQLGCIYAGNSLLSSPATVSFTILMNQPPSSGSFAVTPLKGGIALNTSYFFNASAWQDVDMPLTYMMGYQTMSTQPISIVQLSSQTSYLNAIMGPGLESSAYNVKCIVFVSDYFGCAVNSTASAQVFPPSPGALKTAVTSELSNAFKSSNIAAANQVISAVTSSVNTVNCRTPLPCKQLNRQACSATAQTCGPCLSGFVGQDGDANSVCYNPFAPATQRKLLMQTGAVCANVNASCAHMGYCPDPTCISGYCSKGICAPVHRGCPNSCSKQGTCTYTSATGASVSYCSASDPFCKAACQCLPGSYGKDCSQTLAQFKSAAFIREALCVGVMNTVGLADVTPSVVAARTATIAGIFQDYTQISSTALQNCTSALVATIVSNPPAACQDGSTAQSVAAALSSLLQLGTLLPPTLRASVLQAFYTFNGGCQSNFAVGENPLSLVSDNLRVVTTMVSASSLADGDYSTPITGFEAFESVATSSVHMSPTFPSSASASQLVGASVYQLTNNPDGSKTKSNVVALQLASYNFQSPSSKSGAKTQAYARSTPQAMGVMVQTVTGPSPIDVTVTLLNKEPVNYFQLKPSIFLIKCHRLYHEYIVNFTCNDGSPAVATCPGYPAVFNYTCPSHTLIPQCTMWDGQGYSVNPQCQVIAYTAYNTTCKCTGLSTASVSSLASGHRSLASGDSSANVIHFSSTATQIGTTLFHTFKAGMQPVNMKKNVVIITTLITLMAIFVVGVGAFFYFDLHEFEIAGLNHKSDDIHGRKIDKFFAGIFPKEFNLEDHWRTQLWRWLQLEHSWVCLLAPYRFERDFRAARWIQAMGKLLIFLLVNTVSTALFYPDDGRCENIRTKDVCNQSKSLGSIRYNCLWNPEVEYCSYQAPALDFFTVLLITLVVTVLAIPLNALLQNCVEQLSVEMKNQASWFVNSRPKKQLIDKAGATKAVQDASGLKEYWEIDDELAQVQDTASKMVIGARLRKMQEYIDFVIPSVEAEMLVSLSTDELARYGRQNLITKKGIRDHLSSETARHARYSFVAASKRAITARLMRAREDADYIKREMELLKDPFEKEAALFRFFLVNLFAGYRRSIVSRFVFFSK